MLLTGAATQQKGDHCWAVKAGGKGHGKVGCAERSRLEGTCPGPKGQGHSSGAPLDGLIPF